MAHQVDSCDIIDILEEATRTGGALEVRTVGGGRFVDRVREVITEGGQDFANFRDHGRMAVSEIRDAIRTEPVETSYDAKL
jgi:hypothetical protein